MSRLENLRQRWRESPENSDNWDLLRWRREHVHILRMFYVMALLLGTFMGIAVWFGTVNMSLFYILWSFGAVWILVDFYYVRTIRRLEEVAA